MIKIRTAIKRIRKERGLTQVQLAEIANMTQPHISKIEKGDDGTPIRVYQQIADALAVDLSELFRLDRGLGEDALLQAFRSLSPERRKGWLDMARLAQAESQSTADTNTQTDHHRES